MASTTLITFMLQVPLSVCSVEILGSWDNFCKPYQLQRDRRTGPGHWRGCHTFENITCDGDTMDTSQRRDGGLKMGGTYWYYYLLDGDAEYHDPAEPSTNYCPLLPGQIVNVLDVPMQSKVPSHNGSSTSVDSIIVFTLDPKDKYLPPGVRRAATTSAIQQRKANHAATPKTHHKEASSEPEGRDAARTGQSTLERQRSLLSVFHRLRQTRSAGSNPKSSLAWPRKLFSRAGSRAGQSRASEEIPEVPKLPSQLPSRAVTASADALNLPIQRHGTPPPLPSSEAPVSANGPAHTSSLLTAHDDAAHYRSQGAFEKPGNQEKEANPTTPVVRIPEQPSPTVFAPLEQLVEHLTRFKDSSFNAKGVTTGSERHERPRKGMDVQIAAKNATLDQSSSATNAICHVGATKYPNMSEHLCPTTHSYAESAASSCVASDDLSPYFASNTTHSNPMSPLHLSQPETPAMSEFGDEHFSIRRNSTSLAQLALSDSHDLDQSYPRPPSRAPPPPPISKPATPYSTLGGFHGYSLPDSDHTSVLTIRKLPSNTFKPADTAPPYSQQSNKKDLVESWNDGSEHRMSALSELVDDLGYLGELII